jgi:hypothetical protein
MVFDMWITSLIGVHWTVKSTGQKQDKTFLYEREKDPPLCRLVYCTGQYQTDL